MASLGAFLGGLSGAFGAPFRATLSVQKAAHWRHLGLGGHLGFDATQTCQDPTNLPSMAIPAPH